MYKIDYDYFLTKIYDYSPYFGKERREKDFATQFYLNALENIQDRVLEFVSCTGLLTIPLARANYKVDSVDISPFMHECLNNKLRSERDYVKNNITLHQCDIFDYKSVHKYNGIVLPDSFLLAIADKRKQINLLKWCNILLNNGGIIAFDLFQPWADIIEKKEKDQCSRFRHRNGELYIVNTHHSIDQNQQLHCFDFIHELVGKDKERYHHIITYRYMFQDEIELILDKCGFKVLYIDDSFNFGKYYSVTAKKVREV